MKFKEIGVMHPEAGTLHSKEKCKQWQKDVPQHSKCIPVFIKILGE